jgi:hypothetical protein
MGSNFQSPSDPSDSTHTSFAASESVPQGSSLFGAPENFEVPATASGWQGQLQGLVFQFGDTLRKEETVDISPLLTLLQNASANAPKADPMNIALRNLLDNSGDKS